MRFSEQITNIDPTSDELPPFVPNGVRLTFIEEPIGHEVIDITNLRQLTGSTRIYAMDLFLDRQNRAHKRDCVNCNLRHSSHESVETAYCNHCKHAGCEIFSWYKRRLATRRFAHGILALNVLSRRIDVGEVGISENIMKFL